MEKGGGMGVCICICRTLEVVLLYPGQTEGKYSVGNV